MAEGTEGTVEGTAEGVGTAEEEDPFSKKHTCMGGALVVARCDTISSAS